MMKTRLAWVLFAAASVAGCGTSTETIPDGGTPAPTATEACADLAHAQCTSRDTCSGGFANAHNYGSEAECESRVSANCVVSLSATDTAATPTNREACAQAFTSDAETCLDVAENNPAAACAPPAGSGADGAACTVAAECESAYCSLDADSVCGTCAPEPAVGDDCEVNADCGRDLACAVPAGETDGSCAAYVAAAGSCLTGTNPCEPGLACVGDDPTTATPGTCMAAAATINAACDGSRKTEANCDAQSGLTCIPTAAGSSVGTCQPIMLVGAGGTCGQLGSKPITGVADCDGGGLCVKVLSTDATGTCVAPAADGATCDDDAGPPCLAPAKCVDGTCALPDPTTCS